MLADLLADESDRVRLGVAEQAAQCHAPGTTALLRLKIRLGDEASRVTGTLFDTLLAIGPSAESLNLVLEYVADARLQAEALAALAGSAYLPAVVVATEAYAKLVEPQLRRLLLTALGGSPLPKAAEFLCAVLEEAHLQRVGSSLDTVPKGSQSGSGRHSRHGTTRPPGRRGEHERFGLYSPDHWSDVPSTTKGDLCRLNHRTFGRRLALS